jgi:Tfp pilus assembly protein PilN
MTVPDMTASETILPAQAQVNRRVPVSMLRRLRLFGTGFGTSFSGGNLEAAIVRSRPGGPSLAASIVIPNISSRPAAEWGSELLRFLASAGETHAAATVVLPREEVVVRMLRLAGVADKDTPAAIELQLDTLHPWDEETVEWSWWRVSPEEVVVGIVRQATLAHYEVLFSEAGIPMAAATFSSSVIYTALRLHNAPPSSVFCCSQGSNGRIEIYGESEARPCYSAEFALNSDRAVAMARAELRFPADVSVQELNLVLEADAAVSAVAYAAALAASAPLAASFANLLPADRRASRSRTRYLIPVVLAALLVAGLVAVFVLLPFLTERRYVADLMAEEQRLAPSALRVQAIEKSLAGHKARVASLDDFRRRTQADLDVLNELVRLLPEQVWTNSIEIFPDSVVIAGEADQAAPLLKLLDSSPMFQNSEFVVTVTRNGQVDQFRIRSMRRGRAGRNTP